MNDYCVVRFEGIPFVPLSEVKDIERQLAELKRQNAEPTCQFTYDEHHDKWDTACGQAFQFLDGDPIGNGQMYCGYCGKPIEQVPVADKEGE